MSINQQLNNPEHTNQGAQQPPQPLIPPPSPAQHGTSKKKKRFFEEWHYEIEFCAVAAAVIYAVFTWLEWRTFDSERRTMEAELKEIQANGRLDERPWLIFNSFDGEMAEDGTNLVVKMKYRNTGKTPAVNVQNIMGFAGSTNFIDSMDQKPTPAVYGGIYGPGDSGDMRSPPVPPELLYAEKNGVDMYMFGTIYYDDVFGDSHWTQYCFKIGRPLRGGRQINISSVPFHNTVDGEYKIPKKPLRIPIPN